MQGADERRSRVLFRKDLSDFLASKIFTSSYLIDIIERSLIGDPATRHIVLNYSPDVLESPSKRAVIAYFVLNGLVEYGNPHTQYEVATAFGICPRALMRIEKEYEIPLKFCPLSEYSDRICAILDLPFRLSRVIYESIKHIDNCLLPVSSTYLSILTEVRERLSNVGKGHIYEKSVLPSLSNHNIEVDDVISKLEPEELLKALRMSQSYKAGSRAIGARHRYFVRQHAEYIATLHSKIDQLLATCDLLTRREKILFSITSRARAAGWRYQAEPQHPLILR